MSRWRDSFRWVLYYKLFRDRHIPGRNVCRLASRPPAFPLAPGFRLTLAGAVNVNEKSAFELEG
jgi:hypothetical protein